MKRLPVSEIFGPTIQGEGAVIGRRSHFIRFAGCDYACSWCDSAYTWQGQVAYTLMTEDEILADLAARPPAGSVTLTGGNPALQPLEGLIVKLKSLGYSVNLETQGSLAQPYFALLDTLTVSPKGPSSGMETDWQALAACLRAAAAPTLKVVIFDDDDLAYAREVHRRFADVPLFLQVGNRVGADDDTSLLARLRWLVERTLASPDLANVAVLPQLHVLIWGNRRGV